MILVFVWGRMLYRINAVMASNAVIEPVSTASVKVKKADDNVSRRAEEEDIEKLTDDQSSNDVSTVLKDGLDLAKVVDTDGGCKDERVESVQE